MSRYDRPTCSIPDCGRTAAPEHLWCHAHVLVHAASIRGGYLSLDEARQMVRAGARAEDVMADENDWVAR